MEVNWKDTVMDYEQKKSHGGYNPLVQAYVTGIDIAFIQQSLCEAQAEISFKAGLREVVEWIKEHQLIEPDKDSLTRFEPFYQIEEAQLKKEWG